MNSLTGTLLVAMPQMLDPRFARSVIYLCAHSENESAMGLVINKVLGALTMGELFAQLDLAGDGPFRSRPVHFGGPVETGRGFVLHTADYRDEGTLVIADNLAVTATLDILRAIGQGRGPQKSLLALGYAGWAPGQLDAEIQAKGWLSAAADAEFVFDPNIEGKWNRALERVGIDLSMLPMLSGEVGHA